MPIVIRPAEAADVLPIVALVGFFALVMVYTSVVNGTAFVDFFRNILIIGVFCQLGVMTNGRSLAFVFRVCCAVILSVLLVEIFFTRIYEDLFYPALYFTNTRGLEQVAPGAADRSYGIQVAKLAGLPATVIERAKLLLGKPDHLRWAALLPGLSTSCCRVLGGEPTSRP